MIKNIRVLKEVLLLFSMSALYSESPEPVLTVPHFMTHFPEVLQFATNHAGESYTIRVIPLKGWFSLVTEPLIKKWNNISECLTFRNIGVALVSSALSLGVVSYIICAYIIYKTYRLAKSATAWIHWCSDDELFLDDEELYKKIALHRSRRDRTHRPSLTLQEEKLLLLQYRKIDTVLRTVGLRDTFPHKKILTKKFISQAEHKLQKLEWLCILQNSSI